LACGLGAWDYAVNRAAYWLYAGFLPRYLDWLRGRRNTVKRSNVEGLL
jgi:hypothetical protein